jgi:curved DNA-binding protein CbpA
MTKPTATGKLADTPLCELLVYALTQGLSGSLVLECPDHSKHAVLFNLGAPVKARVENPGTRLGQVLLRRGSIDEAARRAAEAQKSAALFGQRLLAHGLIDAATLAAALQAQLLEQLGWLALVPQATAFAYFDRVDLLESWAGERLDMDPLTAIWRATQCHAPEDRVTRACQGLVDKTLRLHPASRVGRFGFNTRERSVLDVLRVKPQTLGELEHTGLMEPLLLRKIMYVLVLTRHLDTGTQPLGVSVAVPGTAAVSIGRVSTTSQRRVVPESKREPRAPAAPKAEVPKEKPAVSRDAAQTGRFLTPDEITAKLEKVEELSHYELLELEPDASPERIAEAFPGLARRWHPDRLSPEHKGSRDAVTRVFARMTEAHRVLSSAASRAEYDRLLRSNLDQETEQAQVVKVLRAAEAFQKAEILLKKRDLEGAEKLAHLAYTGDDDQPEYGALYAWIRARSAHATDADVAESLKILKAAVAKQLDNVKIRYYFACVLKRDGQEPAALREFRFVADKDPSNLDAARELRLHEMRKNKPPEAPENPSLFHRFFKR